MIIIILGSIGLFLLYRMAFYEESNHLDGHPPIWGG